MYNKVIMVGNLTRDIELKYIPSGSAIAKSAIATSHKYKLQNGEQKEEVCFLDFNVFGRQAEVLNQYVRKGSKVLLEGRLVLEQWTAQDGTNRSKHSLRVDTFKFLDSKSDNLSNGGGYNQQNNYNNYNTPQQPMYQSNNMQQSGGMAPQNQTPVIEEKIPEINIDEEDIPF